MNFTRNQSHHSQNGMALLEVLVAMLIFALAILPLVRLQVMSMDATKAGYYKTETAAAAQSVMDYIASDENIVFPATGSEWTQHIVKSGDNCASKATPLEQAACNILNGESTGHTSPNTYPPGSAIMCIHRSRTAPSQPDLPAQVEINIQALWYIGKRQNESGYYNKDLTEQDCETSFSIPPGADAAINQQNIDSINIKMAY